MTTERERPFETGLPSPIARLQELRASSSESVVRSAGMSDVQKLMARPGQLEEQLWQLAGSSDAPDLVLLTGSAGSGKTAAIDQLLSRDAESGDGRFGQSIADATHSDSPDEEQVERLASFFQAFADGRDRPGGPCRLVAMNTGMAMKFFSDLRRTKPNHELTGLQDLLMMRMGLPGLRQSHPGWMEAAVLVVNLDQRPTAGQPGDLFDLILARLDPADPEGVLEGAPRCKTCRVRSWCWPMANAEIISRGAGRRALNEAAGSVALRRGREISPRALWDASAELALSGLDMAVGEDACTAVARVAERKDGAALLRGLASCQALEQPTPGSLLEEIAAGDPSYEPTLEAHELLSNAGLEPGSDARQLVSWLGDSAGLHPALQNASALLNAGLRLELPRLLTRAAWLGGALPGPPGVPEPFAAALSAQSADAIPGEGVRGSHLLQALTRISDGLAAGFGIRSGVETFFPTEAPAPRKTEVMVKADLVNDGLLWTSGGGDPARARNPQGCTLVGYRPLALALVVAGDVQLAVDLPLWRLLDLAMVGTSPSTVDLDRFLGLRRAMEAVGRVASRDLRLPLLVIHHDTGKRYRVAPYGPTTTLRATEAL